jgi:hypothetical protein
MKSEEEQEEARERFKGIGRILHEEFAGTETMFVLVAVINHEEGAYQLAVAANGSLEATISLLEFEAKNLRESMHIDPREGPAGHA